MENSEKAMAPHSSTLAWKIPWTEEPGSLCLMSLMIDSSKDKVWAFLITWLQL